MMVVRLLRFGVALPALAIRISIVSVQLIIHLAIACYHEREFPSTGAAIATLDDCISLWILRRINSYANRAKHSGFLRTCPIRLRRPQHRRSCDPEVYHDAAEPILIRLADYLPTPPRPPRAVPIKLFEMTVDNGNDHSRCMQRLIETQNGTIARLTMELESWRSWYSGFSSHSVAIDTDDRKAMEPNLDILRAGMEALSRRVEESSTVNNSFPAALDQLARSLASCEQLVSEKCECFRKEVFADCSECILQQNAQFQDSISKLTVNMIASTESLFKKNKADIAKVRETADATQAKVQQLDQSTCIIENFRDRIVNLEEKLQDLASGPLAASHAFSSQCDSHQPTVSGNSGAPTSAYDNDSSMPGFAPGDYVSLQGLLTSHLNGKSGLVISFDETSRRYGIRLTASGELKAFKPCNVIAYDSSAVVRENCWKCGDAFFPYDFPPCGCSPSEPTAFCNKLENSVPCIPEEDIDQLLSEPSSSSTALPCLTKRKGIKSKPTTSEHARLRAAAATVDWQY